MAAARAFQARSPRLQAIGADHVQPRASASSRGRRPTGDAVAAALQATAAARREDPALGWRRAVRSSSSARRRSPPAPSSCSRTDGTSAAVRAQHRSRRGTGGGCADLRGRPATRRSSSPAALRSIAHDTNGGTPKLRRRPGSMRSTVRSPSGSRRSTSSATAPTSVPGGRSRSAVTVDGRPGRATWRYATPIPTSVPPFHRSFLDRFVSSPVSSRCWPCSQPRSPGSR